MMTDLALAPNSTASHTADINEARPILILSVRFDTDAVASAGRVLFRSMSDLPSSSLRETTYSFYGRVPAD